MKVIRTIRELREELWIQRSHGQRIGLVPTMGYFHEGHLSLIELAREKSDFVVVSLYVNPTQFGPNEDLSRYPRDFARDERLARERGTDVLFYPDNQEMYPESFCTYVVPEKLANVLCGRSRPTHFRGVTTIVAKLFNIVQPDLAVFGRKDAQQAIIIKRMVSDLNFPIEIIVAPIVRESDGLAMSSRNTYLSPAERKQAPVIFQALTAAAELVGKGERKSANIEESISKKIAAASLAQIEYIQIVSEKNLQPVATIEPGAFVAVAVWFGKTRLIDNQELLTT
jgi:pantoate--beta-alanine ligase